MVGGILEECAQLPAASEACRHVIRGGKERVHAWVTAPCRAREQDGLQLLAPDRAQVRNAAANAPRQLAPIAGVQTDARLDRLYDELDRVRDQLLVCLSIGLAAAKQGGDYTLEKQVGHGATSSPSSSPMPAAHDPGRRVPGCALRALRPARASSPFR